jgi:hypothetical protein
MLVSTLAGQAAVALGQLTNPITNKMEVNLELAKHVIDTLQVLEEKTKGNLSADEQNILQGVLSQLRLVFVAAQSGKK